MRYLALLGGVLVLSACASPVPPADPSQAWVELRSNAGTLLMADRLDGQRLNDGRFFQVPSGAHELQARFQFEVNRGGGLDGAYEPLQVTCEIRVQHDNFVAGQRYRLEARPMQMKAQSWLYDEQRTVLARGKVLRCGTF
ncbi:hypothetical protein DBR00_19285 [Pseudomonas sp. HMWF032]|uniref:PA0061/PA0062 family lipoprotein n=1 Tax=unclassified Pseudomonas TaxID=196821 RepID=UPI000D38531C|nr:MULTISPECIES: hypothetical protein [unclassified Pseudomonas]PTS82250.1 hypothetical protein DBR00_19285 [Pseudomonas sp. HMWF032]PTT84278.1 hypothetical protein DBR41_08080 [Pseudomonas sp. HMWF010]WAC45979.1 hypothetical protein OU997_07425 [Pseudomonas sp. SL4(2022)]